MDFIFTSIFDFFRKNKIVFYATFTLLVIFFAIGTYRIKIEEDITSIFPKDERVEKLNQIFQESKFMEKLVFTISLKDSLSPEDPEKLIDFTSAFVQVADSSLEAYIKEITYQVDDQQVLTTVNTIIENLPLFLEASDYQQIDSLLQPASIEASVERNYRNLISPTGVVLKKIIALDPIGISNVVLKKLQSLQVEDRYQLYDNFIFTKDQRHLVFFVLPSSPASETKNNMKLIDGLDALIEKFETRYPEIKVSYFGSTAVAVGNARQLRQDTYLTLGLMVGILVVFLIWFFKRKRAPFLILIPVFFGGLFSLSCVYLIQGSISVIAIAAGSIILGIAVNYSLHFFSDLRYRGDVREVIRDLAKPMTLGSATTVLAFFSLRFVNAAVLQDIGLFAGFSLIGAAVCTLLFLPHLINRDVFYTKGKESLTWIDKLSFTPFKISGYWIIGIFLVTPVFFYFANDVNFNSDMNKLNFMDAELRKAEKELNALNEFTQKSVYVVASGKTIEEALQVNEKLYPTLKKLQQSGIATTFSSVSDFVISDSTRGLRIEKWNQFWTNTKKESVLKSLTEAGGKVGFKSTAFAGFATLLAKDYTHVEPEALDQIKTQFFSDFITEKENLTTIVSLVQLEPANKEAFYASLEGYENILAIDKQSMTSMFVEFVQADFNFIVMFTSIIVFVALLLVYGRIELTLITFLPMLITWIWILGIMALLGIEFNIINVMISTFIFGLGDDYSIFTMDGLQQDYKYGRKHLPAIKTSIFLSAFTTIVGLGVLLFAEHPALRSIASISIIGIVCVFVMSQTVEPFLFSTFISNRAKKGFTPVTFWGFIKSVFAFSFFALGSFLLTIIGFVLIKLIPFQKQRMRLAYHTILSGYTRAIIYLMANMKKQIINKQPAYFATPHIIIANHQSFLDILVTTMLHPKIILLTNEWVWNSPVFGAVVRLADYYPVMEGADNVDRLQKRVDEGYSIVVFPEGTRSPDGAVKRFHKGAFFLAERFKLPILPLVLHGTGDLIRKSDFYLHDGPLILKFLEPVAPGDTRFGSTYQERTKAISKHFKKEYELLSNEIQTPAFYKDRLISTFLFKGPVLEWYLRIKLMLENNYEPFEKLIPKQASILDLGCGYGFLAYSLQYMSGQRTITGVDYDTDKIETANHGYTKSERLSFVYADITTYSINPVDVIILNDVLHYLPEAQQEQVVQNCFAAVNVGGKVIIRDGNRDEQKRHFGTKLTEFFSVKLLRFNKANHALSFLSGKRLLELAKPYNLQVEVLDENQFTSNTVFIFEKRA